jgi:hypothetical protein
MIGHRLIRGTALAAAFGAATWAGAGVRTTVTLAGKDDALPKLGMPGVELRIESPDPAAVAAVRETLGQGLQKLVYTRPLAEGEPGDYALRVTLEQRQNGRESATIPFRAELTAADGRALWRIEGHADLDTTADEPGTFASIGRNVLSAMIHDGWLQPRYDVNDPPPAAPSIRKDDTVVQH